MWEEEYAVEEVKHLLGILCGLTGCLHHTPELAGIQILQMKFTIYYHLSVKLGLIHTVTFLFPSARYSLSGHTWTYIVNWIPHYGLDISENILWIGFWRPVDWQVSNACGWCSNTTFCWMSSWKMLGLVYFLEKASGRLFLSYGCKENPEKSYSLTV